ncbi:helix-turn-helix protein [compost metagenome]
MRKKYAEVEKVLMAEMAKNLKSILEKKKITQKELAEKTGLSTSAISDYTNAKTLMSPGNLQMICDVLDVAHGDIDPTFRGSAQIKESSPQYLTGEALGELPIENLHIHNLTRNGKPLTDDQKKRLVQILQSAADLLDQ